MPDNSIEIVYKPIKELLDYSQNPREHPEHQVSLLAESIKEMGWTFPILIDKHNIIIAGHGRKLAAAKLGLASVPTIIKNDLSETQV